MITKRKNGLSSWLEDFVSNLSNKDTNVEAKNSEQKKEAEININDLPKVVWNDETFYVMFDEHNLGATVLNEFGNPVTTLQGITTIEDVDKALNSKQVVVSNKDENVDLFSEEINKISAYLKNADNSNSMTNTTPDSIEQEQSEMNNQTDIEFDNQPINNDENDNIITNTKIDEEKEIEADGGIKDEKYLENPGECVECGEDKELNKQGVCKDCWENSPAGEYDDFNDTFANSNKDEIEEIEAGFAQLQPIEGISNINSELYDKIASLENKINKLVEALSEQEFARIDNQPTQEDLNIGAEQSEVEHFNETAKDSKEKIDMEHNIDISTPKGRVSLVDKLRNEINDLEMEIQDGQGQEFAHTKKEIPENENYFNEIPYSKEDNEDNIDLLDNDIKNESIIIEDDFDLENEDSDNTVENKDVDNKEENIINKNEDVDNEDVDNEDVDNEDENDKMAIKLNNRDSKIFKNAICPSCGDSLIKTRIAGNLQGIQCTGECKSEFAVNLNNGEIYKNPLEINSEV